MLHFKRETWIGDQAFLDRAYKMMMDRKFKEVFPPLAICDELLPTADGMSFYSPSHLEVFNRRNKKMSKIKNEKLEFKKGDKVLIVNQLDRDFLSVHHTYLEEYEDSHCDDNDKYVKYIRKTANVLLSDGRVYRQSSIISYSKPLIDLARSNRRIEDRLKELEKEDERGFFARLFNTKKKKSVDDRLRAIGQMVYTTGSY